MPSPHKILVVDDEPYNVDYLSQELEELGYETISAADGQEAINKIKSEQPDLVLLDIMMPIMDGFTVLELVKNDPLIRDIPIIIISAANSLDRVVKGIKLGAEDYLSKPFEPTLLRARITSSLEKKGLRDLQKLYIKSLEKEFDIAQKIQQDFLPYELPQLQGWSISAYFKAAREVAGDFYDAFTLPNGDLLALVGDVCGKGVGPALFMTLFQSLIRAAATSDQLSDISPATDKKVRLLDIVNFTNNYVAKFHGRSDMFATIFICYLDVKEGVLHYVNCGNEAPFLLRGSGTTEGLSPTGPVAGLVEHAEFRVETTLMKPGDILLAFTDGIPDSQNDQKEFFGHDRIKELLFQNRTNAPECAHRIGQALIDFIGNAKQFDDITLLAIKRDI
jgi:serine phosphatase RsbU (regulator of sigma subunit)